MAGSYQNANPNPVIQVVNNCLISVTYCGPYLVLLVVFVQRTDLCELFGIQIFNLVRSASEICCNVNTFEKDIPRSYCRKSWRTSRRAVARLSRDKYRCSILSYSPRVLWHSPRPCSAPQISNRRNYVPILNVPSTSPCSDWDIVRGRRGPHSSTACRGGMLGRVSIWTRIQRPNVVLIPRNVIIVLVPFVHQL